MSLLDELKIRNQVIDGEVWISLRDISTHTLNAVISFLNESTAFSMAHPVTPMEAVYTKGLAEGMMSIATLLAQGGVEAEFHENINTVEDLLNSLNKEKD
jgi:predicted anti-sigma-YlaC factor YlaD